MASIISAGTTSGTSLNLSGDTSGVLQLATNGSTTALTITTGQLVGIGTTNPSNPLTVRTSGTSTSVGGNIAARIESNGSGYASTLQFSDNVANSSYISMVGSATAFGQAGTERMRITSGGLVGIGTSSPASLLDITGNDPTIRLTDNAGSPASTWSMRSTDGNFAIRDVTNSFDRATFNANGCMALTGANLTANGIGITFPATQSVSSDANTLDDYEEGTFTPTAFGAASAGTTTYTTQAGTYTKIGRQVTITFAINYTALTGTGELRYGNFPFTSGAPEFIGAIMTNGLNWSSGTSIVLYVIPNSTNSVMFGSTDDSGWSPQQCVNEAADVRCTVTYFTS